MSVGLKFLKDGQERSCREEDSLEKSIERGEGDSPADLWIRGFQAKKATNAKALRQKHA